MRKRATKFARAAGPVALVVGVGVGAGACGPGAPGDAAPTGEAEAALAAGSPLVGAQSGRCLDVAGNNPAPGTGLIIYQCNGQANQRFEFTAAGELRVFGGTRCVQAQGGQTTPGARAVVAACSGQLAQQWRRNADGSISNPPSSLCLDVSGQATADESPVIAWGCNGQENQRWALTAGADTQPPTPPGDLAASGVTCEAATLSWSASTDDVGVAFYDVYHDGQFIKAVDGATRSTAVAVVPGVTWGLYVNARDAAGNVSQASATVALTPPPCQADTQPPTPPAGLGASAAGTTVTLAWAASTDDVGVAAYDVYRDGEKAGTVAGAGPAPPPTSFTDSGLAPNATYAYYVVARDAQGNASPASAVASATTGAACGNPICSVAEVAADADVPWGLVNLPDGAVLYGRRDAHDFVRLDPRTGQKSPAGAMPGVQSTDGEGGLMGLAVAPDFATDPWLYVMHTSPTDNRVVRVRYAGGAIDPASVQVLVSGLLRNKFHNGGRLRFGPDGKLYASTGDAQNGANAQSLSNLAGKVLRIDPDGGVPADNPFAGSYVYSYGHRNPQGLAFDSRGRLWEQEFGNSVMDETNLIVKGGNYGWPDCEGTVSQGGGGCATPGYVAPKRTYPTAEASCSGIAIVRDVLYVACGRGARLYREVISGDALTDVQQFFVGTYGRLRTVEPTPDGNLWLTTTNAGDKDSVPNNSDEKILRVLLGG